MNDDKTGTPAMDDLPPLGGEPPNITRRRMSDPVRAARLRAELIRWSEAYLAEQLARAVARGKRVL